ncbi:Uncharacterised protein [Mycobacteroides abscessus subsp. abscessus]|nr:Uncharacterised protein [Mycobacteroides abscessus subsp. abscessus]
MVAAVSQGGVIESAGILAHPDRLAADLQHQGRANRIPDFVCCGNSKAGVGKSFDILVATGERHGRMNGQRHTPQSGQRIQDCYAVGPRGMHHDRSGAHRTGGGKTGDQGRQLMIRHREDQQFSAWRHFLGRQYLAFRQALLGASA